MKHIETLTADEREALLALDYGYDTHTEDAVTIRKALCIIDAQAAELAAARSLVQELTQHLDYIGWGDSYEREHVCAKGGLEDRAEAFQAEHPEVST